MNLYPMELILKEIPFALTEATKNLDKETENISALRAISSLIKFNYYAREALEWEEAHKTS